jgi:hypothetical protein
MRKLFREILLSEEFLVHFPDTRPNLDNEEAIDAFIAPFLDSPPFSLWEEPYDSEYRAVFIDQEMQWTDRISPHLIRWLYNWKHSTLANHLSRVRLNYILLSGSRL